MEPTDSWTPLTLEAMLKCKPSGSVDDSSKDALGALLLQSVQDAIKNEGVEESQPVSYTTFENPLSNPSVPLEDIETSFTPPTLSEMHHLQNNPSIRKRVRFLDLPAEIRNLVYSELLTPGCGAAMDFASCADCLHEKSGFERFEDRGPEEVAECSIWYGLQWHRMRSLLCTLSLVSRQTGNEASTLFWSQPFRFTSDIGWIVLYHFLESIGEVNVDRLRDVTVCHPAFSVTPDFDPIRQATNRWGKATMDDYYDLFDDHLGHFCLGACIRAHSYTQMSEADSWKAFGSFDGPIRLLSRAANLTKLSLTLPQFQFAGDQPSFRDLFQHPIHTIRWPQKELNIRVIHLTPSYYHDRAHTTLSLEDIYRGADYNIELVEEFKNHRRFPHHLVHETDRADLARVYFEQIKQLGWQVVEMLYDLNCQYLIKDGQRCANKDLCRTLLNHDEESMRYSCYGDREEVLEHEGKGKTIERIVSDQKWGNMRMQWGDWVQWAEKETGFSLETLGEAQWNNWEV